MSFIFKYFAKSNSSGFLDFIGSFKIPMICISSPYPILGKLSNGDFPFLNFTDDTAIVKIQGKLISLPEVKNGRTNLVISTSKVFKQNKVID
ncbi:hypothetical protein JGI16_11431, partial [Candidatus Kryptonium thompsonii]